MTEGVEVIIKDGNDLVPRRFPDGDTYQVDSSRGTIKVKREKSRKMGVYTTIREFNMDFAVDWGLVDMDE